MELGFFFHVFSVHENFVRFIHACQKYFAVLFVVNPRMLLVNSAQKSEQKSALRNEADHVTTRARATTTRVFSLTRILL